MRKPFTLMLLFIAIHSSWFAAKAADQLTEDSLIQAWEEVQKNDPQTINFEKIESRRYKFKTKRFPFDGELKLLNAVIDDEGLAYGSDFGIGVIEYDLVGLANSVQEKYERSYAQWDATNTLYYNKTSDRWVDAKEYKTLVGQKIKNSQANEQAKQENKNSWVWTAVSWLPVLVILGLWIFMMRRMNLKKNRDYMTKAEEHLELANAHMKRVEDMLEKIVRAVDKNERPQS